MTTCERSATTPANSSASAAIFSAEACGPTSRTSAPWISTQSHISTSRDRVRAPSWKMKPCGSVLSGESTRLLVKIVGAPRVVAGIHDQPERFLDPLGGLLRTQVVEDEQIGLEHRREHIHLGFFVAAVVRFRAPAAATRASRRKSRGRPCVRITSFRMPTARWVLPTPCGPYNNRPLSTAGKRFDKPGRAPKASRWVSMSCSKVASSHRA